MRVRRALDDSATVVHEAGLVQLLEERVVQADHQLQGARMWDFQLKTSVCWELTKISIFSADGVRDDAEAEFHAKLPGEARGPSVGSQAEVLPTDRQVC